MKVYFWKTSHNVYNSLLKAFSSFNIERYETHPFIKTFTSHLEYSNKRIEEDSLYLTKSPLLSLFTWKLKLKDGKAFIFEEYFRKGEHKDKYVEFVLKMFKNYPFIAMTKRTREFLENNGLETFYIPPAEKKRKGEGERKYITMVSRLVPSKNISLFFELAKAFPRERFLLIGRGPMERTAREFAFSHPNFSYIRYISDRENLFKFYLSSKVLIHPPLKDPIGFVIVESLACSTPVLSSIHAGASDFLPKKWVVNSFSLEEWRKKLSYVLDNLYREVRTADRVFTREKLNINSKYLKSMSKKIERRVKEMF